MTKEVTTTENTEVETVDTDTVDTEPNAQDFEAFVRDAYEADKDFGTDGKGSPYAVARVVNNILEGLGALQLVGSAQRPGLPPQMIYTYVRNGMIEATGAPGDKDRKVYTDDATIWTVKYLSKNVLPKLNTK